MPISISEQLALTCLSCGEPFTTEVWSLVDATERPELAQELLDDTLNLATCPHCGTSNQAQVALLFHDPERRRVYFAVPSGVEEHRWREQAQALLYTLANQLPEEAQLPYLADVQVDQEIAGVRRSLLRRQRARSTGAKPSFGKPIPMPGSDEPLPTPRRSPAPRPQPPVVNIGEAIEHVMAVSSADELRAVVQRFPQLLSQDADDMLRQLADTAFNQGDRDTANAVHTARQTLSDLRAGRELSAATATATPETAAAEPDTTRQAVPAGLPETAYQALLHTASDASLMEAIRLFPVLLETWADDVLEQRMEAALEEGNERLATLIEERRDALGALRIMLTDVEPLEQATQALLAARDTDTIERALNEHPVLLTDAAQQALAAYAQAATVAGNAQQAAHAEERRAMLQQVRAGIDA